MTPDFLGCPWSTGRAVTDIVNSRAHLKPSQGGLYKDGPLYLPDYLQKVEGFSSSLSPLHLCQTWLISAGCGGLPGDDTAGANGLFSLEHSEGQS